MSKHIIVDGKLLQVNKSYSQLKNKQKMDALEQRIAGFKEYQAKIQELETYYTSPQWKDDFAMDEEGKVPKKLRRGVLSEDGIYNMLERNKEMMKILDGFDS